MAKPEESPTNTTWKIDSMAHSLAIEHLAASKRSKCKLIFWHDKLWHVQLYMHNYIYNKFKLLDYLDSMIHPQGQTVEFYIYTVSTPLFNFFTVHISLQYY